MAEDISAKYWSAIEKAYDDFNPSGGVRAFREQYAKLELEIGKLLAVHWCVSEVCNGGFYQFFYNDTGVLAPEAAGALEAFGMTACAAVVRQAMSRLGPGYPRRRWLRVVRLWLAQARGLKSSEMLFDTEDAKFYESYGTEAGGYEKAGVDHLNSRQIGGGGRTL